MNDTDVDSWLRMATKPSRAFVSDTVAVLLPLEHDVISSRLWGWRRRCFAAGGPSGRRAKGAPCQKGAWRRQRGQAPQAPGAGASPQCGGGHAEAAAATRHRGPQGKERANTKSTGRPCSGRAAPRAATALCPKEHLGESHGQASAPPARGSPDRASQRLQIGQQCGKRLSLCGPSARRRG